MNRNDRKEFRNMVIENYKAFLQPLYMRYREYTSSQIRLEYLAIISEHVLSKSKEAVRKKINRKNQFAQLKRKVEQLEFERGDKPLELKAIEQSF